MNKVEKIKAEIERRKEIHFKDYHINKNGNSADYGACNALTQLLSFIDSLEEEPISNDLEEAANSCSSCIYLEEVLSDDDKEVLKERLVNTFKAGAQWQKANLWKNAQGNDLPEIDREVVVLAKALPEHEDSLLKVAFAHRPPEYWMGKSISTGEITRYEPKRYDNGGWNQPNVVYWLDVELPNEE